MNTATVSHGALFYVMAVNVVIWAGIAGYLFYLDRKVKAALQARRPQEGAR
jgi:CcmD family protein